MSCPLAVLRRFFAVDTLRTPLERVGLSEDEVRLPLRLPLRLLPLPRLSSVRRLDGRNLLP